jgi:hypothetical protein
LVQTWLFQVGNELSQALDIKLIKLLSKALNEIIVSDTLGITSIQDLHEFKKLWLLNSELREQRSMSLHELLHNLLSNPLSNRLSSTGSWVQGPGDGSSQRLWLVLLEDSLTEFADIIVCLGTPLLLVKVKVVQKQDLVK